MRCIRVLAKVPALVAGGGRQVLTLADSQSPAAPGVGAASAVLDRLTSPPHAWPALMMGVGLVVAGLALALRVGLYDRGYLALNRGARLTFFWGLTLGTTLAVLGLVAALTALL
jgi:hypothetical protein